MQKFSLFFTVSLMSIFLTLGLNAQVITGTVTNAQDGQPLPAVNVLLKNSSLATLTDFDGKYSITIDSAHKVLVFSYIGMETQEIKVRGRRVINVKMSPSKVALEEVVLVEYDMEEVVSYTPQVFSTTMAGVSTKRNRGKARSVVYEAKPMQHNTEGYTAIHENGFKKVAMNPLSTFSIDVDAASYSNMRRFINNGSLPPVDAVRIEEMINYFTYNYPQPKGDDPFSINHELSTCPWNTDNYLLHIGLQGKTMDVDKLPPSNLVFLIDVSGSMGAANKLPLLKASFHLLVDQLRPNDRIAIVVYAGSSGLVLESTPGSKKQSIKEALNRLQSGGSTAGGAGLKLAYKVAEEHFMEEGNNRIILATDGDFNVGQSSNAEMERLIEKEREKGIAISVLGFGMGNYKDDKMEVIADKGNGNYAYIDNLQEAKKVLVNEFGGTLFTIAKDVKFQLEFNPAKVQSYRLIGYENRLLNEEDFNDDKKDAGEMGAGHTVTALYEIVPARNAKQVDPLKYQNTQLSEKALKSNDLITLKLRYKKPDGFKSKLLENVVKNQPVDFTKTSDNFRFSAGVAEFGMLLRDSEFLGTATFDSAVRLVNNARGADEEGYRGELVRLIKSAALLKESQARR